MDCNEDYAFSSISEKEADIRKCLLPLGLTTNDQNYLEQALSNVQVQYNNPDPSIGLHGDTYEWKELADSLLWTADMLRIVTRIVNNFAYFHTFSDFHNPGTEDLMLRRDSLAMQLISLFGSKVRRIGNFDIDGNITVTLFDKKLELLRNQLAHRYGVAGWAADVVGEGLYDSVEHWNWLTLMPDKLLYCLQTELWIVGTLMEQRVAWEGTQLRERYAYDYEQEQVQEDEGVEESALEEEYWSEEETGGQYESSGDDTGVDELEMEADRWAEAQANWDYDITYGRVRGRQPRPY